MQYKQLLCTISRIRSLSTIVHNSLHASLTIQFISQYVTQYFLSNYVFLRIE